MRMSTRRTVTYVTVSAASIVGLLTSTGVAHAALSSDVLLTTEQAQQAAGYSGPLTQRDMPVSTPGLLMRMWSGTTGGTESEEEAADGPSSIDTLTVMVIDPAGTGGSDGDSKQEAEKAKKQAQQANPGMECKVYENKGTKITIVCWSEKDQVMVMAISSDLKVYYKKKKVKGKMQNVPFKRIPVIGQVQHTFTGKDTVTAADKDQAFREGKGLRDAQVAKLPATYS